MPSVTLTLIDTPTGGVAIQTAIWLAEHFRFKPAREAAAATLEQQDASRRAELAKMGIERVDELIEAIGLDDA